MCFAHACATLSGVNRRPATASQGGTEIMMTHIDDVHLAARDFNRQRAVDSTVGAVDCSDATRLSAAIGRAIGGLFKVGRETRAQAAAMN